MTDYDEQGVMIRDCLRRESIMTEWELTFIRSINIYHMKNGYLTSNQADKLEEVWERVTTYEPCSSGENW